MNELHPPNSLLKVENGVHDKMNNPESSIKELKEEPSSLEHGDENESEEVTDSDETSSDDDSDSDSGESDSESESSSSEDQPKSANSFRSRSTASGLLTSSVPSKFSSSYSTNNLTPAQSANLNTLNAMASLPLLSQVKAKWEKPIEHLPVKTDFPRMFARTSAEDNGIEIWSRYVDRDEVTRTSKEVAMKDLVCLLAKYLDEEDVLKQVDDNFFSLIPNGSGSDGFQINSEILKLFEKYIGEKSGVTGIVKCINQAIVVPAVILLRLLFMKLKINFKDCRAMWDIHIAFSKQNVMVVHKKWEETIPTGFMFCWHLSIELNRKGTEILQTTLQIKNIKFLVEPTEQRKQEIFQILKEYYDPTQDNGEFPLYFTTNKNE